MKSKIVLILLALALSFVIAPAANATLNASIKADCDGFTLSVSSAGLDASDTWWVKLEYNLTGSSELSPLSGHFWFYSSTANFSKDLSQSWADVPCGEFNVGGTVTAKLFVSSDPSTQPGDSDPWDYVFTSVPFQTAFVCECGGCTYTPGWWMTHNMYGPAKYEPWALADEDAPFFSDDPEDLTWIQVLKTSPRGNAYYNLSFQYIAAVLNGLVPDNSAGASVQGKALYDANGLFETYKPSDIAGRKGSDPIRKEFIRLAGILSDYNTGEIGPGHCDDSVDGLAKPAAGQPVAVELSNSPNPFNPNTTITFSIPESGHTTIKIYNSLGTVVATLVDKSVSAGKFSVDWNAKGMASGIYFCRIQSGSNVAVRKLMLLK